MRTEHFDFDTVVSRRGTNSLKYDFAVERGMPQDVLPLWVADMDFQTAPCVCDRLAAAAEHGIFGYSEGKEAYFAAVAGWYRRYFSWDVQPRWLIKTPGVVFALAMAVKAFTNPGEGVLIQQPVYYPFREVIEDNRRRVVSSPLRLAGNRYVIDFEDLEAKIVENHIRLFLFCSPHNPVSRVWEPAELSRIGQICARHNVIVVSDEIHSDFTWEGHRHTVFAKACPQLANRCIICTAPTKAFNLAGLQISNIFIADDDLRQRFAKQVAAAGYSQPNVCGLIACQAAYEGGHEWLAQVKDYIWKNYLFLETFVKKNLPQIRVIRPEGTYLIWLDCRGLGLTPAQLDRAVIQQAGLWLDSGAVFGSDGAGFQRINIACPRTILADALGRLARVFGGAAPA